MPSRVKAHFATRAGKRYRVRSFTRYGPEHTAKWKRMVAAIKRGDRKRGLPSESYVYSPEAVATMRLGFKGTYTNREQRKIQDKERARY
jgi:hypothetical protein